MRCSRTRRLAGILALSYTLAGGPLTAQQSVADADSCALAVGPRRVHAGVTAVKVTTRFSDRIGEPIGVAIAPGSGIELASEGELRRLFGGSGNGEGRAPAPLKATPDSRGATLWLNLLEAAEGRHSLVIRGERGSCAGTVVVG